MPLNILHVVWAPWSYPCVVSLLSNSFVLSFSWTHSESRCKFYSALLGANSIFRRLAMTPIFFLGIKHPVLFLLSLMIVLALKRLRGSIFLFSLRRRCVSTFFVYYPVFFADSSSQDLSEWYCFCCINASVFHVFFLLFTVFWCLHVDICCHVDERKIDFGLRGCPITNSFIFMK